MKIFVTVGTTPFDSLIRAVDVQLGTTHDICYQISSGKYKPQSGNFIQFTRNIEKYYNESDLIISHAGAGSIYRILELNLKLLIVANLDRVDHHQKDICKFMSMNNYSFVCEDLRLLGTKVADSTSKSLTPYVHDSFTGVQEIRNFLGMSELQ